MPSFTFYEIVEPIEIRVIEELVRQSLPLAGIDKVSLVFYEKQNWVTTSDNGGGHRGHENAIKRITVENQADGLFLHESGVMKTPQPGLER